MIKEQQACKKKITTYACSTNNSFRKKQHNKCRSTRVCAISITSQPQQNLSARFKTKVA